MAPGLNGLIVEQSRTAKEGVQSDGVSSGAAFQDPDKRSQPRIPGATYRLQLSPAFRFRDARKTVSYLARFGITDLYLSPILKARPSSTHGYDIISHSLLNPELGTDEDFLELAAEVHRREMGLIVDIVPNHMAVMTTDNSWWMDVLENGPAARAAKYFDIDWRPTRLSMHDRLLVPVLAAPFGEVLEKAKLRIIFDATSGTFSVAYLDLLFPLDPGTYPLMFHHRREDIERSLMVDDLAVEDFVNILEAFSKLPAPHELDEVARDRRYRDKEVNKRRLARLCDRCPPFADYIATSLDRLNGRTGQPRSFDLLEEILNAQPYRLAFWRVSGEEINYRRFFDVDQLAALRVEDPEVFAAVHAKLASLLALQAVDGLRIDHADGLQDPTIYFRRLQELVPANRRAPFVVVEKILSPGEKLNDNWEVNGTTGYEFGALVTGWLLDERQEPQMDRIFRSYTGEKRHYPDIVYESKKLVMRTSLAAEITVLAIQLDRIAQSHRPSVDFTYFALRETLVEVIACFPVYRTYVTERSIRSEDRSIITRAVGMALSHRLADHAALEFLQSVLTGSLSFASPQHEADALRFVMKFQQVTGPVMAKGTEDTAFYRYPRLLAANEVGGDPGRPFVTTADLHEANRARQRQWPHSFLATSTHDTKRGEDVRYRLCTLSEMPQLWNTHLQRWRRLKRRNRGASQIDPRDEYLLLQTLLAIWPAGASPDTADVPALRRRLCDYAVKAAREAKIKTSWLDPDAAYEATLASAVLQWLPDGSEGGFYAYFRGMLEPVAFFGMLNGLSATVLKFTSPGVPDLYQGTELPRYVLVDPDNRQPVDFEQLSEQLHHLEGEAASISLLTTARHCLQRWWTGEIKLFVTWKLLELRRQYAALFTHGKYIELRVQGRLADHVCAFARHVDEPDSVTVIVVVARWLSHLVGGEIRFPVGLDVWEDTYIELDDTLPPGSYLHFFSGNQYGIVSGSGRTLAVSEFLSDLPVAVLAVAGIGSPEERSP